MRILIKNGYIVDGTGEKGFYGDVLIDKDKIIEIGEVTKKTQLTIDDVIQKTELVIDDDTQKKELDIDDVTQETDLVIDAAGLIVAPGFIDTHSHSDLEVLIHPEILPKLKQGITTEVLGQDGISMAPLPISYISPWRKNLAGLDGDTDDIDWNYEDTKHYLRMIEAAKPSLNVCYLLPHGNIRMEAMGLENRKPTEDELERMRAIVRREMQAGAIGISDGLIYMPCAYSGVEEIIEICKVAAEYNGVYVVHQRSEADSILSSMEEIIQIGKESGIPIHFSHFKVCGKKNWDKINEVIAILDRCKEEGIKVSFDQYPYVAGSTMLGVILPPWAHDGGTDRLMERLSDSSMREKMIYDIKQGIPGWDNFIDFAGLDQIYITSVKTEKNRDAVGLSLIQLGELRGKDPYQAAFDLLLEEENAVGMVDFYGKDEHVALFMKRPEMNACTDGLLGGKPHPRVYGAFPRILSTYVREKRELTIEEAINKMTDKAAKAMHIQKRGQLAPGFFADICIFNGDTIKEKGTFTDPARYPEGIEYVLVNGTIAVDRGEFTKVRCGRVLRR